MVATRSRPKLQLPLAPDSASCLSVFFRTSRALEMPPPERPRLPTRVAEPPTSQLLVWQLQSSFRRTAAERRSPRPAEQGNWSCLFQRSATSPPWPGDSRRLSQFCSCFAILAGRQLQRLQAEAGSPKAGLATCFLHAARLPTFGIQFFDRAIFFASGC